MVPAAWLANHIFTHITSPQSDLNSICQDLVAEQILGWKATSSKEQKAHTSSCSSIQTSWEPLERNSGFTLVLTVVVSNVYPVGCAWAANSAASTSSSLLPPFTSCSSSWTAFDGSWLTFSARIDIYWMNIAHKKLHRLAAQLSCQSYAKRRHVQQGQAHMHCRIIWPCNTRVSGRHLHIRHLWLSCIDRGLYLISLDLDAPPWGLRLLLLASLLPRTHLLHLCVYRQWAIQNCTQYKSSKIVQRHTSMTTSCDVFRLESYLQKDDCLYPHCLTHPSQHRRLCIELITVPRAYLLPR